MNVAEVLDLRRSGHGYKAIGKQLGISSQRVAYLCRKNGLGGSIAGSSGPLDNRTVSEYVSRSGFDYVGGYTNGKAPITVRCRECGRTFERQFHIFRDVANGTWSNGNECPLCREDRKKIKEKERRQQAERDARIKAEQRERKSADLISRQLEERLAIHVCKNCGKEYCIGATGYNSKQYCSEKCMKRWAMRVKNDRRIRKMKQRRHDNDITLEKLFRRDGGVCYLCGGICDWDDMPDGNAGDSYPSIDHVVPLAKSGTHTWDNVKLAHRKCNWEKRDSQNGPR